MNKALLKIRNLKVYYKTREGYIKAVDDVSFELNKGERMALVGESGSGKTTLALAIIRLLDFNAEIVGGEIILDNMNLLDLTDDEITKIRGKRISFIFQDPSSALNPVFNIGYQVEEKFLAHRIDKLKAFKNSLNLLKSVGISDTEKRYKSYPYQLSGGMKQRVVIAIATALNPSLIIADEPTSGLDVTIQAQVLELLKKISDEYSSSILLITHDIGVAAEIAEKIAIMYAGKIVELGKLDDILNNPLHPYTRALMGCVPRTHKSIKRLFSIKGSVPSLINPPSGCRFHPRCPYKMDICEREEPRLIEVEEDHYIACHQYQKR